MQKTNSSRLLSLVLTLTIVMSLFAGLTVSASATSVESWVNTCQLEHGTLSATTYDYDLEWGPELYTADCYVVALDHTTQPVYLEVIDVDDGYEADMRVYQHANLSSTELMSPNSSGAYVKTYGGYMFITVDFVETGSSNNYAPTGTMSYLSTHASEGTSGTVWSIGSKAELIALATYTNNANNNTAGVTFYLTADIDLNSDFNAASINPATAGVPSGSGLTEWTPIAGGASTTSFQGIFDGCEYTINNIFYNQSTGNYGTGNSVSNNVGLFGKLERGATLKNLKMDGGYFGAQRSVGALVGKSWGNIDNCHNLGVMVYGSESKGVGGIVGANWVDSVNDPPAISNSSNAGAVYSAYSSGSAGGIAGENEGSIFNCVNTGAINSPNNAGGIVGSNKNDLNKQPSGPYDPSGWTGGTVYGGINNCYNTGSITGKISGGIAAYQMGSMRNCYNIGAISGTSYAGQIIGELNSSYENSNLFRRSGSAVGRTISGSFTSTLYANSDGGKDNMLAALNTWVGTAVTPYSRWTRDTNNVINSGFPVFVS